MYIAIRIWLTTPGNDTILYLTSTGQSTYLHVEFLCAAWNRANNKRNLPPRKPATAVPPRTVAACHPPQKSLLRMGLSLEFDPGEHEGRHLKAECAPCVPLTLPFPYCRCAYTYASPDTFCPVCQGAFEKSSTSASGPAGICLLNIGINMMTSTMQVLLGR